MTSNATGRKFRINSIQCSRSNHMLYALQVSDCLCVCVTFIAPLEMFNRVCLSVQLPCIMRYITFDFISHVLFHLFDLRSINWQPNAFTAVVLHTISSFVIFCFSWIKLTQFFLFSFVKTNDWKFESLKKKNKQTNKLLSSGFNQFCGFAQILPIQLKPLANWKYYNYFSYVARKTY